jgi:hypothetical protein
MLERSSIEAHFGWYETGYNFLSYKVGLDLCISGLNWHPKVVGGSHEVFCADMNPFAI